MNRARATGAWILPRCPRQPSGSTARCDGNCRQSELSNPPSEDLIYEICDLLQHRQQKDLEVGQPFNPFGLFTGIFIPDALVRSTIISPGAKLVYGRLARYAGQDGRCYPAVETLASEVGLGERQVQRYLAELEREHLIRRVIRYAGRAQTSNGFEFLWHEIFQKGVTHLSGEGVSDPSPPPLTDASLPSGISRAIGTRIRCSSGRARHTGLRGESDAPAPIPPGTAELVALPGQPPTPGSPPPDSTCHPARHSGPAARRPAWRRAR